MRINRQTMQFPPIVRFFFARIFPLVFLLFGAVVSYFSLSWVFRAKASEDWPFVTGVVIESQVERRQSIGDRGTMYYAEVFYEYVVDGTTYNGNRISYGDYESGNPSRARRVVNRYPQGSEVDVYYRPENPEECLLEPGLESKLWIFPALGLAVFTAGAFMAVILPKVMKQLPRQDG